MSSTRPFYHPPINLHGGSHVSGSLGTSSSSHGASQAPASAHLLSSTVHAAQMDVYSNLFSEIIKRSNNFGLLLAKIKQSYDHRLQRIVEAEQQRSKLREAEIQKGVLESKKKELERERVVKQELLQEAQRRFEQEMEKLTAGGSAGEQGRKRSAGSSRKWRNSRREAVRAGKVGSAAQVRAGNGETHGGRQCGRAR